MFLFFSHVVLQELPGGRLGRYVTPAILGTAHNTGEDGRPSDWVFLSGALPHRASAVAG